ncbi:pyridoxal phosphate-dependent aminotransferase [Moritella marina ATCC 15381]|uniref:Aminotransferase n=1 Tax=Moritella marina ATCC 15381 TaxID=1202962 RepID=A0A5J6WHJ9_MORMI|nr:pyridoxal phosphate-dependent aminotransferase [Moritella marina]QFI37024.1 pyridoxal phosphate-dependent aminotransferase [Moritella marina ATCC 15381]
MKIQDWVFKEAYGKYSLDLGDSNAPCLRISDFNLNDYDAPLEYGRNVGTLNLTNLVAQLYQRSPNEVGISHGSQEAMYLLYRTILTTGDHVITFSPGWEQAWEVPNLIGCRVTKLEYNDDYSFNIEKIIQEITPFTKLIVINSPCNPTGKILSEFQKKQLIELVEARGILLLVDEEYLTNLSNSLVNNSLNVISVSSLSKVYGAPGLRIGWMCGSESIITKAMSYKHHTTISNSILCEEIAISILKNRKNYMEKYNKLLSDGYEILKTWGESHKNKIRIIEPQGTPFAWIEFINNTDSLMISRKLLNEKAILVMPAEVFGKCNGIRLTFARKPSELYQGLRGLSECF